MSFRYPVNNPGPGTLGRSNSLRTFELGGLPRGRAPISPPETERSAPTLPAADRHPIDHHPVAAETTEGNSPEETAPYVARHIRRAPSIHYHQPGLTTNMRTQTQRTSRWLIVVMPPSSLNVEPVLGHTLATGPPGRFQSGILMPLFPTMYAQLTAIAKEFNLPSTTGVCIYLHVSKANLNISPRISDEAWQLLWGPYFNGDDSGLADMSGLPICGQIEFDVDIRRARWYDSWLNRHDRLVSLDASIPASIAHTMSRWYNEHREMPADEPVDPLGNVHDRESISHGQLRAKPVPRPLALSTHGEHHSNRSHPKYKVINAYEGDGVESIASKRGARRLSPVVQSATAKQEKDDLDTLVRNWRATTPMAPAIPRTNAQGESLEDPDTMDSRDPSEIDMNDFQWSVSSYGPASPAPVSPQWTRPLPSVDLDGRLAGSVMLTPSIATSFGPGDSVWSPMVSTASPFASPGIADRMVEDCPCTPTTMTSWGAPSPLPLATPSHRVPTPDLAMRQYLSRPATPSTATTWGAPSVGPDTPASLFYRATSPDLGQRGLVSVPNTPSTATSWGPPAEWPPSPMEPSRPPTPDVSSRELEDGAPSNQPFRFVWPLFDATHTTTTEAPATSRNVRPFRLVWPFFDATHANADASTSRNVSVERISPVCRTRSSPGEVSPFPYVWPFFKNSSSPTIGFSGEAPRLKRRIRVSPDERAELESAESGRIEKISTVGGAYDQYDYPNLVIYPPVASRLEAPTTSYGYFNLYPAVYPSIVPYPPLYEVSTESHESLKELPSVRLSPAYPSFDLYPPVCPALHIHPVGHAETKVSGEQSPEPLAIRLQSKYPNLEIYPPVYPHLDIYPTEAATKTREESNAQPPSMALPSAYPHLNIYPAVYPFVEPYPSVSGASAAETREESSVQSLSIVLPSAYPHFNIYPAVYPFIEPYPPVSGAPTTETQEESKVQSPSTVLPSTYPHLNVYPAVYPFIEPYPSVSGASATETQESKAQSLSTVLPLTYPHLNIYPAAYPFIEPYPSVSGASRESPENPKLMASTLERRALPTRLPSYYPRLEIYPAGYPMLEIYPPVPTLVQDGPITPTYSYPHIVIYEPVHISDAPSAMAFDLSIKIEASYPFFDLYPSVYPYLEVYPPVSPLPTRVVLDPIMLPGATCHYPDICIYPPSNAVHTRNTKQLSVTVVSTLTKTRMQSPRTRVRRGSNQWGTVTSPVSPKARRGSVDIPDTLERNPQLQTRPGVTKAASRPRIKPRKSHQDLHHEVFAQLAPHANDLFGMKPQNPTNGTGTGLRRIASARVDGATPLATLSRSKTVARVPPLPTLPKTDTLDLAQSVRGSAPTAVASRVSHFSARDGGVSTSKAPRPISKLEKSRYAFL